MLTAKGHEFLRTHNSSLSQDGGSRQPLLVHLEGDMVQALRSFPRTGRSIEEARSWGRGWADPDTRCQRLTSKRGRGKGSRKGTCAVSCAVKSKSPASGVALQTS